MSHPLAAELVGYFRNLSENQGVEGPIGELTAYLAGGNIDSSYYQTVVEKYGLASERWFEGQRLDLLLGYTQSCIDAGERLTTLQIEHLKLLRSFLRIRDGEFASVRPAEVATILREQLHLILTDAFIDTEEDLYQTQLQNLFGLGYDDYFRMTRVVFERVWDDLKIEYNSLMHQEITVAKMVALEPLVRLAVAQTRSLGALYT